MGQIKRKINLQFKLRPDRNACKVHDFEKFGLQKYLIFQIPKYCNLKELGKKKTIWILKRADIKLNRTADKVYQACACRTTLESALTKKVQPCLTNTDLIPDHDLRQLLI